MCTIRGCASFLIGKVMYRIALIQNESEMMRYSWADVRPMLAHLSYSFDAYVAENLFELFQESNLPSYDAIIIASNACNDKSVYDCLKTNSSRINDFLNEGKGIFVSFQMKKSEVNVYDFLPEDFVVFSENRIQLGEHPKDGNFAIGTGVENHIILQYPIEIQIEKVKKYALTNNLVNGLYWIYLKSKHQENYNVIIEDDTNPDRPLLLSSRDDFKGRIVISAIAMDWQKHDDLWENSIKYVTEGRPSIAAVRRTGRTIFDFNYILSSLEIDRIPFTEYCFEDDSDFNIPIHIHDTIIFDPSWNRRHIENFIKKTHENICKGQLKICYFNEIDKLKTLEIVSNEREYDNIYRNAIVWILDQFPKNCQHGYWGGSFWSTLDVVSTLVFFQIPLDDYKEKILQEIKKHDKNGSYDEVLGATCAMLQIYEILLGKDEARTQRALAWIIEHADKKSFFEKATAYDVLLSIGHTIDENLLLEYKNQVSNLMASSTQNDFSILRHSKTLFSCRFFKEAERTAILLKNLQNQRLGHWINIPNTASVIELLINIQQNSPNPKEVIDDMIFKGVQYIRSCYSPELYSWKNDVSATSKSLKSLKLFEYKVSYPVDFAKSIVHDSYIKSKRFTAIDIATTMNIDLHHQIRIANEKINSTGLENRKLLTNKSKSTRLNAILITGIFLFLSYVVLFVNYLSSNNKLKEVIQDIISFTSHSLLQTVLPVLTVSILVILVYILKKLKKLPKFIEVILSSLLEIKDDR